MPAVPDLRELDAQAAVSGLQTGDLLLFSGRGLASDTVRLFTRSYWSHIGIVVRLRDYAQPLLLESTTLSDSNDLFQGHPVRGVGLVPCADKVRQYRGEVALRRWQGDSLSAPRERMLERLALRLCHRPYKNYVLCHLRSWLTGYSERDCAGMFCSELVAELYRRLGRLPTSITPRNFVPGHFAADALPLLGGEMSPLVKLRVAPDLAGAQAPLAFSCP